MLIKNADLRHVIRVIGYFGAGVVFLVLVIRSTASFNLGFDYLWYHLPEALLWYGNTTFIPSRYVQVLRFAQPPLAEIAQGFLIFATGKIQLANSINLFALIAVYCAIVIAYRQSMMRIDALTFGIGLLAIPLVLLQATSGYTDLFGNCGILLGFSGLPIIRTQSRYILGTAFVYIGMLVAWFSRYTLWPASSILFLVYATVSYYYRPRPSQLAWARTVIVLGMLLMAWPNKKHRCVL